MALSVKVVSVAAPASAGGTVVVSGLTDPKAVIAQCVLGVTAEQAVAGTHAAKSMGFATKDGGALQQHTAGYTTNDVAATSVPGNVSHTARMLKVLSNATTPTVGLEMHVAAAGDWTTTQITFTFPVTTSGAIVHLLILGGAELTARCGTATLSVAAATQDITVVAGFGRPDAVMFLPTQRTVDDSQSSTVNTSMGFGVNAQDGSKGAVNIGEDAGSNTMALGGVGGSRGFYVAALSSTLRAHASLDATVANWPTDGFRLAYSDQADTANKVPWLALKGIQVTCGLTTARTAVGTTSLPCGFAPKAVMWGHVGSAGAADAIDTTGALLTQWSTGFKDLSTGDTRHNYAGSDDGQGTSIAFIKNSNVNNVSTEFLGDLQTLAHGAVSPTVEGRCLLTANGNNVDMDWSTDAASLAVNIAWIAFGDPVVAGTTYTKTGQISPIAAASGADAFEAAETGTISPKALASGSRNVSLSKTGVISPKALMSGGRNVSLSKTGQISPKALASAADIAEFAETALFGPIVKMSGADVAEFTEAGTVAVKAALSGVSQKVTGGITYTKTGTIAAKVALSGAKTVEYSETGAISPKATQSSADVFEARETGQVQAKAALSGTDTFEAAETGQMQTGARLSGADAATFTESGAVGPKASLSGSDESTFARSGSVNAKAALSGTSSTLASNVFAKTGTIAAKAALSGADVFEVSRTGKLTPKASLAGTKVNEYTESGTIASRVTTTGQKTSEFVETGFIASTPQTSGTRNSIWTKQGQVQVVSAHSGYANEELSRDGTIATVVRLSGIVTAGAVEAQELTIYTYHFAASNLWIDEVEQELIIKHVVEEETLE